MENMDNEIIEIQVNSYMLKKPYMRRISLIIISIIFYFIIFGFFNNFLIAGVLAAIITTILSGLLFGWRETLNAHYRYNCPKCGFNMTFALHDKKSKLTDSDYKGRCPKCTIYHIINYKYDGNMDILK